jgi:hypothetical protein
VLDADGDDKHDDHAAFLSLQDEFPILVEI